MKNLLIVEDNMLQSHFLANSICKEVYDVRLYSICTTGKEAIDIIKSCEIDVIILDLKLPDMTGMDIIDYISKNKLERYISSIIIVTGEMEMLSKVIGNQYIFNYCSKINSTNFLIEQIKLLLSQKHTEKDTLYIRIKKEMEKLNFNFSYIGTKYLYDCICECAKNYNIYDINLTKNIYPIIAKKYNKKISSIKANIFHSEMIMYYETEEKTLKNYFGYNVIYKPKTKDIITTILQKLK